MYFSNFLYIKTNKDQFRLDKYFNHRFYFILF